MSNFSSIIKLSRSDLNSLEIWSARRIRPALIMNILWENLSTGSI